MDLEFDLKRSQLRVFVNDGYIRLVGGKAFVCYAPLVLNKKYYFASRGFTIEVPSGARIQISGRFMTENDELNYSLDEVVSKLDEARASALVELESGSAPNDSINRQQHLTRGPRVVVVGGANTGKSYTGLSLVNAAMASKEFSIGYVDVDVGQQGVSVPGCISCVLVEDVLPFDSPFAQLASTAFFYGEVSVTRRGKGRYLSLCESCAEICAGNAEQNRKLDAGGMIINTMGWTRDTGLELLREQVVLFHATHIILTEEDPELEDTLKEAMYGQTVQFLHVKPTPSIAKKLPKKKINLFFRDSRIKQYFEGTPDMELKPVRSRCRITDVEFIDTATMKTIKDTTSIQERTLCAVSKMDVRNDIRKSSVAGFIVILEMGTEFFSFLAPQPGNLPCNKILVSPIIQLSATHVPPLDDN